MAPFLNGISEIWLSRNHQVTSKKKKIEEMDNLVVDKPDCIIIHAEINNITNGLNSLNSVKKSFPNTNLSSPV